MVEQGKRVVDDFVVDRSGILFTVLGGLQFLYLDLRAHLGQTNFRGINNQLELVLLRSGSDTIIISRIAASRRSEVRRELTSRPSCCCLGLWPIISRVATLSGKMPATRKRCVWLDFRANCDYKPDVANAEKRHKGILRRTKSAANEDTAPQTQPQQCTLRTSTAVCQGVHALLNTRRDF